MDMMYANLFKRKIGFKHKIRFELVSEHPDNEEHRFYSVGRQYVSNKIENAKSIGSTSWFNLCADYLHRFFIHVISMMTQECPIPIDRVEIKASIRLEDEEYDIIKEKDIIGLILKKPKTNINQFKKRSVMVYYGKPDKWWNEPFYIVVKAYSYISQKPVES